MYIAEWWKLNDKFTVKWSLFALYFTIHVSKSVFSTTVTTNYQFKVKHVGPKGLCVNVHFRIVKRSNDKFTEVKLGLFAHFSSQVLKSVQILMKCTLPNGESWMINSLLKEAYLHLLKSASSLAVFRRRLKTFLFFAVIPWHCHLTHKLCVFVFYTCVDLAITSLFRPR